MKISKNTLNKVAAKIKNKYKKEYVNNWLELQGYNLASLDNSIQKNNK